MEGEAVESGDDELAQQGQGGGGATAATAPPAVVPQPGFTREETAAAHAELEAIVKREGLHLNTQPGMLSALYELGCAIGKGKFATVYRATRRRDGQVVAVKEIAIFDASDARSREKCLKEIRLVQALEHPNIVRFLDGFVEGRHLVLVFEFAEAGDLKRQLRKARERGMRLEERVVWRYFAQIAEAVAYMHSRRIIHRDLKPANVFLTLSGAVKVGDLGLGRLLSADTLVAHSKVGTPLYMAPECLKGGGHEYAADVWSLGCILYELAAGASPFKEEGLNLYGLFQKITSGAYAPLDPALCSPQLRDLVTGMLAQDPAARPDLARVVAVATEMRAATAAAQRARAAAAASGGGGGGGGEGEGEGEGGGGEGAGGGSGGGKGGVSGGRGVSMQALLQEAPPAATAAATAAANAAAAAATNASASHLRPPLQATPAAPTAGATAGASAGTLPLPPSGPGAPAAPFIGGSSSSSSSSSSATPFFTLSEAEALALCCDLPLSASAHLFDRLRALGFFSPTLSPPAHTTTTTTFSPALHRAHAGAAHARAVLTRTYLALPPGVGAPSQSATSAPHFQCFLEVARWLAAAAATGAPAASAPAASAPAAPAAPAGGKNPTLPAPAHAHSPGSPPASDLCAALEEAVAQWQAGGSAPSIAGACLVPALAKFSPSLGALHGLGGVGGGGWGGSPALLVLVRLGECAAGARGVRLLGGGGGRHAVWGGVLPLGQRGGRRRWR
jgi:tRNA A-37 threonylcarbamoyl transferase component Bud32